MALNMAQFRAAARGGKPVVQEHTILPDTKSPGVALSQIFNYQSYFDTTLLEKAILPQSPNEPIVNSTLQTSNVGGYSFGLHPSSQTPIAVQPIIGGQTSSPQAVILKPGDFYRPHGRIDGQAGHFSGFTWGLPFGWLGGGLATLYVFPSPDGHAEWHGNPEILFHRQTIRVIPPAQATGQFPFNWPYRFPWPHALRGASSVIQQGPGVMAVTQTRILIQLGVVALVNPATMRIAFQQDNDFSLDSAGQPTLSPVRFVDYTWASFSALGAVPAVPVDEILGGPVNRISADDGGVAFIDANPGFDLAGTYVNVCRYGYL